MLNNNTIDILDELSSLNIVKHMSPIASGYTNIIGLHKNRLITRLGYSWRHVF